MSAYFRGRGCFVLSSKTAGHMCLLCNFFCIRKPPCFGHPLICLFNSTLHKVLVHNFSSLSDSQCKNLAIGRAFCQGRTMNYVGGLKSFASGKINNEGREIFNWIGQQNQELAYLRCHHIGRNATHYIQQLKQRKHSKAK